MCPAGGVTGADKLRTQESGMEGSIEGCFAREIDREWPPLLSPSPSTRARGGGPARGVSASIRTSLSVRRSGRRREIGHSIADWVSASVGARMMARR